MLTLSTYVHAHLHYYCEEYITGYVLFAVVMEVCMYLILLFSTEPVTRRECYLVHDVLTLCWPGVVIL